MIVAAEINEYPGAPADDRAISWPAIFAGAFAAAAVGLILLALGAGTGLSLLSPFGGGPAPRAVGLGELIWYALAQIIAGGLGGYLAGRFRTKWVGVHPHERHFRDSAHGFLAWAVGLVLTTALVVWAAAAIARMAMPAAEAAGATGNAPGQYFVDRLFRPAATPAPAGDSANGRTTVTVPADAEIRSQAEVILARSLRERALATDDRSYLAQLVTATTGLGAPAAQQRVDDDFAAAQQAFDARRKDAAHFLYWLFVALLLGAFSASWMATIGGRNRETLHVL
ncbi:MAG: hypothetical protein ACREL5_15345 [Gemmatimonadales bacterium]